MTSVVRLYPKSLKMRTWAWSQAIPYGRPTTMQAASANSLFETILSLRVAAGSPDRSRTGGWVMSLLHRKPPRLEAACRDKMIYRFVNGRLDPLARPRNVSRRVDAASGL